MNGSSLPNTVSRESFGHINVDDVDIGVLGIVDSTLDGAIQAGCGVVDLGLRIRSGSPWTSSNRSG
jgi:hypothetical protein